MAIITSAQKRHPYPVPADFPFEMRDGVVNRTPAQLTSGLAPSQATLMGSALHLTPDIVARVSSDATGWVQAIEKLREDCARLATEKRRHEVFLSALAHELRNPLAPIRLALDVIGTSTDLDAQRRARAVIQRQTEQLSFLVEDMLDLRRIHEGKLRLDLRLIDLNEVLTAACEGAEPLAKAKRQQIAFAATQPYCVRGDRPRLVQVFVNLLRNAVKFSAPDARVALGCKHDGEHVLVTVSDPGRGIAAEHLAAIFELFREVEVSGRRESGLGIGLALVKEIIELHGGAIEVASPGLNQGSTFTVRLPCAAAHADPLRDHSRTTQ